MAISNSLLIIAKRSAKLGSTKKIEVPITFLKLGFWYFQGIANKGNSNTLILFNGPDVLLPASDRENMGADVFSENSDLDDSCKISVMLKKFKCVVTLWPVMLVVFQ